MEQVKNVVPDSDLGLTNLQIYWKIFQRKKFYLIVPLVLSVVISINGTRQLTPIYESHTLISIEDKNYLAPPMERYVQPEVDSRDQLRNQKYRAMIETRVLSNDFLRIVIEDLGLNRSEKVRLSVRNSEAKKHPDVPLEELVIRHLVAVLKKKIEIQNPKSSFFTIGVYDTDPGTAFVLADKIAEKFIEITRQDRIQGVRQAGEFSDEQLAIYKEKLEASEKELARVKRELASAEVENNPVNASNIHYAQALKQTVKAEVERSDISLRKARSNLVNYIGMVPSSDRIASDEAVLNWESKLEAYGEEKLLRNLSDSDQNPMPPDAFNEAVEGLRARISELVATEYSSLAPDLRPLVVEYFYQRSMNRYYSFVNNRLQSFLDQYTRNYERKPALEREYNRLSQEVQTNRAIYQAFLESKTSARVTEAVQSTDLGLSLTIIERAEKPLIPVKPDPLKIILIAVIFGIACGLGAILVTEYLDDSFRSVEEVEKFLAVPVLGTVPKMAKGFAWEKRQRGIVIISWIAGIAIFIAVISAALYIYAGYLRSSGLGLELKKERTTEEVKR